MIPQIEDYALFMQLEGKKNIYDALDLVDKFFKPFTTYDYEFEKDRTASEKKKFKKNRSAYDISMMKTRKSLESLQVLDSSISYLTEIIDSPLKYFSESNEDVEDIIKQAKEIKNQLSKVRRKQEKIVKKNIKELSKTTKGLKKYSSAFDRKAIELYEFVKDFIKQTKEVTSIGKMSKGITGLSYKMEQANEKEEKGFQARSNSNELEFKSLDDMLTEIDMGLSSAVLEKGTKSEIKEEVKGIRRTKPKLISISRANLEKLKQSEMLEVDLELLSKSFASTRYSITTPTEKIRKGLESLKQKIATAKENIGTKKTETSVVQHNIDSAIDEARMATHTYKDVIDQSKSSDRLQSSTERTNSDIEKQRQELLSERQKLAAQQGLKVTGQVVEGGEVRNTYSNIDNSERIGVLTSQIHSKEDEMSRNQVKMEEERKASLNRTISIPERFKDMKRKLEEKSKLKEASKQLKKYKGGLAI